MDSRFYLKERTKFHLLIGIALIQFGLTATIINISFPCSLTIKEREKCISHWKRYPSSPEKVFILLLHTLLSLFLSPYKLGIKIMRTQSTYSDSYRRLYLYYVCRYHHSIPFLSVHSPTYASILAKSAYIATTDSSSWERGIPIDRAVFFRTDVLAVS